MDNYGCGLQKRLNQTSPSLRLRPSDFVLNLRLRSDFAQTSLCPQTSLRLIKLFGVTQAGCVLHYLYYVSHQIEPFCEKEPPLPEAGYRPAGCTMH